MAGLKIAARLGVVAALATLGGAPAEAQAADGPAQTGFYAALRGYGSIEDQNNFIFENSREIAVALGYRAAPSVRLEAEFGSRRSDIVGLNGGTGVRGDASVQTLGLHAFYDFRAGKKIRPFVGVGVGGAVLDFSFSGPADISPGFIVTGDDQDFSHYFDFFAGTSYHINDRWRLSASAEYVTLRDDSIDSNIGEIDGINRAYNYTVGVRYFFGANDR
ncbi:outer membrane beta-barrel protein [Hyphomonas johnsonii]|uniref:OmpA/MotB domain-containing protein n=1 Tax=Hyphomonas johnsonii MHS-2 TaxID=1280950 RepID=A0A059FTG6_9PROT|nr:outer membrane beta-barrel protein [Hyphomonas johnsonii]KCZ93801.1 OmpA/MotB domain-containing protein [Hyphomonas johnsonii MHS-2]